MLFVAACGGHAAVVTVNSVAQRTDAPRTSGSLDQHVEERYTLDAEETVRHYAAEDELSNERPAHMTYDMLKTFEATLELHANGTAVSHIHASAFEEEKTGKWRRDGDKLVITYGDGFETPCAVEGPKLTCNDRRGFVFKRVDR